MKGNGLMLSYQQKEFWQENGYLVLPQFFSQQKVEEIVRLHKKVFKQCPDNIVVDNITTNRRCYVSSLSPQEKKHSLKINDLYLNYHEVRSLSLNESLVDILGDLLGGKPVLCNTLSLDYGTQQFLHVDSLYMTPLTDEHLVATWIALEDCHPDAGPLVYVPGSHKIPIYRFSNGSAHQVNKEFAQWQEYIKENVDKYGLKEEIFLPKKGDVFIWHAQLLHGGSPINNPRLTRKSIVNHYFTQSDCKQLGSKLIPHGSGFWMDRPPQEVEVSENRKKITSSKLLLLKIEHILRTTLHYFRLWKRDVLNFSDFSSK